MKRFCSIPTPLGEMTARSEEGSLCGLWFVGQKYAPVETAGWIQDPCDALFGELRGQLAAYFKGKLRAFDLPLAARGTHFQREVWNMLCVIPTGTTTSYGALARQMAARSGGSTPAAQAVGGAVGHNPISIIIPCHRVVAMSGALTGYAAGLERKAALLTLEGVKLKGITLRSSGSIVLDRLLR